MYSTIVRSPSTTVLGGLTLLAVVLFSPATVLRAEPGHTHNHLQLVAAAKARTLQTVRYDGAYVAIAYPNGDVPNDTGVCTDLIIRAYRAIGIDLQQQVHEDMRQNFSAYPSQRIWGLNRPDQNIDHRRVPNLQTFFTRFGTSLPISKHGADYLPGDIVIWRLANGLAHIGMIADTQDEPSQRPLVLHNIGAGPKLEDRLFQYTITGHYRYLGK